MDEDNVCIRPCGGSWQYCDGRCSKCQLQNTTSSITTELINDNTYYSFTTNYSK